MTQDANKTQDGAQSAETAKPERETYYLLNTGVFELTSGKRGYSYLPLTKEEAESGELAPHLATPKTVREAGASFGFWSKPHGIGRPGSIIQIEGDAGQGENVTKVFPKTAKLKGWLSNKSLASAIQAISDAEERAIAEANRDKKEGGRNLAHETLLPLRAAYKAASPAAKTQLLAEIIRFVTTGE